MTCRRLLDSPLCHVLVLGWVLIAPPDGGPPPFWANGTGCGDPGHLDTCAPLSFWRKLGSFESTADCRRLRDERIARADSDIEWSDLQMSRCFPDERLRRGGLLRPDE
jgi:hypothetical protein